MKGKFSTIIAPADPPVQTTPPEPAKFLSDYSEPSDLYSRVKDSLQPACIVCAQSSPYLCKRCSKPYCTVKCYRTHGETKCSEEFYKECAEGLLRRIKGEKGGKKKAAEIVAAELRAREVEEEERRGGPVDEEEYSRIVKGKKVWLEEEEAEKLLEKLQNDELSVESLSQKERELFFEFIGSEAKNSIQEVTPFWEIEEGISTFKVEEIEQKEKESSDVAQKSTLEVNAEEVNLDDLFEKEDYSLQEGTYLQQLVASRIRLKKRILDLPESTILRRLTPDKWHGLWMNLLALLVPLPYLYRKYNGDWASHSTAIASIIEKQVPSLSNDWKRYYFSMSEAMRVDLLTQLVGVKLLSPLLKAILEDLCQILSSRFIICEMLYQVYDVFLREYERTEIIWAGSPQIQQIRTRLNCRLQKLIFFITLVRDSPESLYQEVVEEVKQETLALAKRAEFTSDVLKQ